MIENSVTKKSLLKKNIRSSNYNHAFYPQPLELVIFGIIFADLITRRSSKEESYKNFYAVLNMKLFAEIFYQLNIQKTNVGIIIKYRLINFYNHYLSSRLNLSKFLTCASSPIDIKMKLGFIFLCIRLRCPVEAFFSKDNVSIL
jgi:hypothetical protein